MDYTIRLAHPEDHDAILSLAGRAWDPVFQSVNSALGPELARRLHGEDWRVHHAAEVGEILASQSTTTWVAEDGNGVIGFAAASVVDPERRIGQVRIVGVDPTDQRRGVGSALTREAEGFLRKQRMAVVFIGTGGDAGHGPARLMYEALGYVRFPVMQYYKVLNDDD